MARVSYVKSARERRHPDGTIKPLNTCDCCAKDISVGSPYKYLSIQTGPYSSRKLIRCDSCPVWHVWEYSNSASARTAQIVHEAREVADNADDPDEIKDALATAAESVRELVEEKRESAGSIEDGFGHPTAQSEELTDLAEQLEQWAIDLEQADVPDLPEPEDADCEECEGNKTLPDGSECSGCEGTGHPSECTEDQMDGWRDEVQDALSVLDNSPV